MFGGDAANSLHQSEEFLISPETANRLSPIWETTLQGPLFKTPVLDGNRLFASTYTHAYGINRANGQILWEKSIDELARECPGEPGHEVPSTFTLLSETSPAVAGDRVVFATLPDIFSFTDFATEGFGGGFLLIVDKAGKCLKRVRVTDHTFEGILGSPTVHQGVAYVGISGYEEQVASFPGYSCCSTIGKVCAVDLHTGLKKWCTHLIDADPSTPEYDETATIGDVEVSVRGISGVTVWSSSPAIDTANGQLIVTTGNAYTIGADTDLGALDPKSLPIDAFVAIDLATGVIKNVQRVVPNDFWNVDCLDQAAGNCEFEPVGPDYDFGAGANIVEIDGRRVAVATNKAGMVYGVDATDLSLLWQTKVGPTTLLGLAGSATDGNSVYVSVPNFFDVDFSRLPESPFVPREWTLQNCPSPDPVAGCPKSYGGILSALDPISGNIRWQSTDPFNLEPLPSVPVDEFTLLSDFGKSPYLGPPASANGVVFQGALNPNSFLSDPEAPGEEDGLLATLFAAFPNANASECPFPQFLTGACKATFPSMRAYSAATGEILWTFNASGFVIAGAAIADGFVYWGSIDVSAEENSTLYAFTIPPQDSGIGGGQRPSAMQGGGCSLQEVEFRGAATRTLGGLGALLLILSWRRRRGRAYASRDRK